VVLRGPLLVGSNELHSLKLTAKAPENRWVFPKIVVPQNGWFIMENPIKIDDLGVPAFKETPR